MSSPSWFRRLAPVALIATASSGCSYLFVKGPPTGHENLPYFTCTESNLVPALDAIWAGLNGLGAARAASAEDGTYVNQDEAMLVGTMWLVVSGLSSHSGFRKTKSCRTAVQQLTLRLQTGARSAGPSVRPMFSVERAYGSSGASVGALPPRSEPLSFLLLPPGRLVPSGDPHLPLPASSVSPAVRE
jgi:hypothetical protein